jgi:hypothetical protein
MSGGRGVRGNREVSPLFLEAIHKEGGSWGKHGFPHASEPKASDAHDTHTTRSAVITALTVATGSRIFQPKRINWS